MQNLNMMTTIKALLDQLIGIMKLTEKLTRHLFPLPLLQQFKQNDVIKDVISTYRNITLPAALIGICIKA